MAAVDALVSDFLAQQTIAIVGVSDHRETGCNLNYRKFKAAGYRVFAVNPQLKTYDGAPCYPDLRSLPERPDGVFVLAKPAVTDAIVRQCVELGIRRVWMHCLMGTKPGLAAKMTSVSPEAVALCHANGITVIPGTCPAQFLRPDAGHRIMRALWRLLGFLRIDAVPPSGVRT
jgi:predicted CoA-binding protein